MNNRHQHGRLTNHQIVCLSAASVDRPVYGETRPGQITQMPNGAYCFHLRTIESLQVRGFLKEDGRAGYLLTPLGIEALKAGMGF